MIRRPPRSTHCISSAASDVYKRQVCGCPSAHTGRPWLSVCVRVCPCVSVSTHRTLWVSISTHRTSLCVRQHTQDVCGCLCVCVCPSAHTGRPWPSISTHISTLVLRLSMLPLPVDCLGDFSSRRLSVQYTQAVRVCLSAHIGRPCVSVSTHRTSVAVHKYTYQHPGPWTQHAGPSRGLFG